MLVPFVLLPLYLYPTPGAWDTYYSSISSHPDLQFTVVVNPNSGPGSVSMTQQVPDSNWIAAIATLNSYANVRTIGYVHTSEATRALTDVEADISVYANWASYTEADIAVDGIFFDEAPSTYTTADFTYMSTAASSARTAFTSVTGDGFLVFNPGTTVDSRYFALANSIVVFEDYYSAYSTAALAAVPTQYVDQSSFLIHDFNGSTSAQQTTINQIQAAGIQGLFITTSPSYSAISSLWPQFSWEMGAL